MNLNQSKILAAVSLMSTFAGAAPCFAAPDIVGGTLVQAGEELAKSTVAIYLENSKGQGAICTGSLLNQNTLITAAHCVKDVKRAAVLFARNVSSFNKLSKNQIRQVTAAQAAPGYNAGVSMNQNDIAIVQFAGGIPEGYSPAKVMDKKSSEIAVQAGAQVVIAGYGITSAESKDSGVLRKTTMVVRQVTKNQTEVLLVNTGHSACHGDSGGPAFIVYKGQYLLWGVTSRGDDQCSLSIYTKIQSYLNVTPSGI